MARQKQTRQNQPNDFDDEQHKNVSPQNLPREVEGQAPRRNPDSDTKGPEQQGQRTPNDYQPESGTERNNFGPGLEPGTGHRPIDKDEI